MMATTPHPVVLRSNELTICTATQSLEISQLRAVLDEQHYLKAGRPAGHVLWQGAYEHDLESGMNRLVAVFCWAGAAKRLTLGLTKGFRRHRADFYQDLESPKQLWVRPLHKNARSLLSLPGQLPEEHQKGVAEVTCGARCGLPNNTLRGLRDNQPTLY